MRESYLYIFPSLSPALTHSFGCESSDEEGSCRPTRSRGGYRLAGLPSLLSNSPSVSRLVVGPTALNVKFGKQLLGECNCFLVRCQTDQPAVRTICVDFVLATPTRPFPIVDNPACRCALAFLEVRLTKCIIGRLRSLKFLGVFSLHYPRSIHVPMRFVPVIRFPPSRLRS